MSCSEGSVRNPINQAHVRICHIVATTEGATWAFEQLRDLKNRFGYDVTVILNGDKGTLVNRFKDENIRVLVSDFEFLNSSDVFSLPKKIWNLSQLLKAEKFDVVQTHLFHSMVIGRIAGWLADVPVRLSMVAGPFHLEAYTSKWIDISTQWMETMLIPSCEYTRAIYRSMGVSENRLKVIYYGPDENKFDPTKHSSFDVHKEFEWDTNTLTIGMVAYFYPELGVNRWTPPAVQGKAVKCHSDMIKAMPLILQKFPQAKLIFVGSGWGVSGQEYLDKMHLLVEELGLKENIVFAGFRSNIPSILKSLDVSVQASLSENLGGTIEGLLMECPMVATRVGGMVDSVIDGKTGVIVDSENPTALANGIVKLLHTPALAKELGRNGRQFMLEKFTLQKTVESEHQLYQLLLSTKLKGYRKPIFFIRCFLGILIGSYIVSRYLLVDSKLLPILDAGWKPWLFVKVRRFFRRIKSCYAQPSPQVYEDTESLNYKQYPCISFFQVFNKLFMYRFYSYIGRKKLGWGIRRRTVNALNGILKKFKL